MKFNIMYHLFNILLINFKICLLIFSEFLDRYLRMKLHTIEHMEAKVKSGELKQLDDKQLTKMAKKKEISNLIKAVEYSRKIAAKNIGR